MDKLNELMLNKDLLFAYLKKSKYYDQLITNEGNDKYIMSIVNHYIKKQKVEVFRVSKILEPGLRERIFLLDQGYPVVYSCNNYQVVYSYLTEVKALSDNVCDQVREQLKNLMK